MQLSNYLVVLSPSNPKFFLLSHLDRIFCTSLFAIVLVSASFLPVDVRVWQLLPMTSIIQVSLALSSHWTALNVPVVWHSGAGVHSCCRDIASETFFIAFLRCSLFTINCNAWHTWKFLLVRFGIEGGSPEDRRSNYWYWLSECGLNRRLQTSLLQFVHLCSCRLAPPFLSLSHVCRHLTNAHGRVSSWDNPAYWCAYSVITPF